VVLAPFEALREAADSRVGPQRSGHRSSAHC